MEQTCSFCSRLDDLRFWALEPLVIYLQAAAQHGAETLPTICARIASRHDVQLLATT